MNIKSWIILAITPLFVSCTILEVEKKTGELRPLLEKKQFTEGKMGAVEETVAAGPKIYSTASAEVQEPKREVISRQEPKNYMDLNPDEEDLFPITINFENVDIRDGMKMLSEITGKNILVSDEVEGTITVGLKNVPWNKALDAILQTKRLAKHVNDTGDIIRIHQQDALIAQEAFEQQRKEALIESVLAEQAIAPLYTEIFRLYYAEPSTLKREIQEVLGLGGGEGGESGGASVGGSYGAQIAIDDRTKSLIIKASQEDLDSISNLIQKIDIRTKQVLIEAFIVEATDDFSRELGARLGIDDPGFINDNQVSTAVAGTGGSQGEDNVLTLGDATGLISNFAVSGGAGLGFLFKSAAATLKAELSAMEKEGFTKIISNPRIFTLDNEEAVIIQGDEIPYTVEGETEFKEAGIKLTVTPSIVGDGNITLVVAVEKKTPVSTISPPPLTIRQITTKLLVRDNTIVMIGGVFTQTVADAESKIPFFGDLPIIGHLFRTKKGEETRKELLVFLAPRII
jgi:type IV pilus assembly protein PilQ